MVVLLYTDEINAAIQSGMNGNRFIGQYIRNGLHIPAKNIINLNGNIISRGGYYIKIKGRAKWVG